MTPIEAAAWDMYTRQYLAALNGEEIEWDWELECDALDEEIARAPEHRGYDATFDSIVKSRPKDAPPEEAKNDEGD